ncbi:pimeloyl-[acyl-carrier protein] methyl ester esterase [Arsukibacterium tuosuense]|uniref:Pimeloyl-[acyl-carrier protein] methyl ester esterase n=1 Tax=Arsukibacterium tuosuense TaxID=1323745 RepID=A0A285JH52_9GAMM|nr:pimeloyl-ACP methyl ester esterase BioH [Arsukibacterium tuosuense]SNY59403.1 pimeloyl-[acyl-carrier protein] methyl ester esterase [Arsukibacterium tuosuense]
MAEISKTDKPVLVLLHGWGVNQGVWHTLLADIQPTVQVLPLDIPGFGLAQQLPEPYNFDTVLADLARQIPDNSLLCGWSLGGLLAIALAKRYPAKVRQLALVAATPCFLQHAGWPGMKAAVMQQFAQSLQRDLSLTIGRFLAIQAMGSATAKSDAAALKQAIAAFPQASATALSAGLEFLSSEDLREDFAGLAQPVVGCFGALDSLVPAAVVCELQKLLPAAELTVLAKASHAPFISHRSEFLGWLNHWLTSVAPRCD